MSRVAWALVVVGALAVVGGAAWLSLAVGVIVFGVLVGAAGLLVVDVSRRR